MAWPISAAEVKQLLRLRMKAGSASGAKTGSAAPTAIASISEAAPSISDTSATATALAATRAPSLASSISAKLTPLSSSGSTVWLESPIGYVERGCPKITAAELLALGPIRVRLETVAAGRGETIEQMIGHIVAHLVDMQSPWLEASLGEMLPNYVDNFFR